MFPLRYGLVLVAALAFVACGDSDSEWVYTPPEIELELTGTVISSSGHPFEGATIALWDGAGFEEQGWVPYIVYGASTRTKADGSYRMARTSCFGLGPDDDLYLEAVAHGYQSAQKDPTSCFQEVNFVLEPAPPAASGR